MLYKGKGNRKSFNNFSPARLLIVLIATTILTLVTLNFCATPAIGDEANASTLTAKAQVKTGWKTEGGKTYFYRAGKRVYGWVVDATYKNFGLQRYWLDMNTGELVKNKLIKKSEAGWWAYASADGRIVRGKYRAKDGYVYLADNDGKLENPGWKITAKYDGELQRYYIDAKKRGAKTGFFRVEGKLYHGNTYTGYEIRTKTTYGDGLLLADNDGVIYEKEGWLVTSKYDGHLERYRIDRSCGEWMGAHLGFFRVDNKLFHANTYTGVVVRGKTPYGSGIMLSDNEGIIYEKEGWLVTGKYDGGNLQRYRIDDSCGGWMGAHLGQFSVEGKTYYGLSSVGYCLRNETKRLGYHWWKANNDGVMTEIWKTVLGVSRAKLVQYLEQRQNGFFLGTRYSSGFTPRDCMYPNGARRSDGYTGMNCTGFVAFVWRACGGNLGAVASTNSHTPWRGGAGGGSYVNAWRFYGYAIDSGAKIYRFRNVAAMLNSGLATKGDIIFFNTFGQSDCHIGFFWGDTPYQNKMWHQISSGNQISKIFNNANRGEHNQQVVLIK